MKYISVGHTKKAHALGGELKIQIEPRFLEDVLKAGVLFIEQRGTKAPFFIENIRQGQETLVKFEESSSRTEAENLQSKEVFLRETDILPDDERELEIAGGLEHAFLVGFRMIDRTAGDLGEILEVQQFPSQEMAVLERGLVPLIPVFLKKIDRKTRTVEVDLPEGLV